MASLTEFLAILAKRWPDPSERGRRFESYLCEALRASNPHQFINVWLWDDWPGRDGPDVERRGLGRGLHKKDGRSRATTLGCQ